MNFTLCPARSKSIITLLFFSANESSYELPDDLFDKEKGDVKPTKAKKKTALNGKKLPLKRSVDEVEVSPALLSSRRLCYTVKTQSTFFSLDERRSIIRTTIIDVC